MLYGNALFLQNRGSAHGFLGADGGGQQNDVIAFAQHAGTVELHRLICREMSKMAMLGTVRTSRAPR